MLGHYEAEKRCSDAWAALGRGSTNRRFRAVVWGSARLCPDYFSLAVSSRDVDAEARLLRNPRRLEPDVARRRR